ncbi:TIGR04255 family protein [Streptomyces sp. NPDC057620]|uniref:TIGR04255 family protein n=1 Tax=Streptomyces sp. NPDC057620 TaxID=3346185 RepID=UPI0036BEE6E9
MDREERGALFERLLVEDIPLPHAPLVRVIGQLRFGTLSVLASGDEAPQAFIGKLSADYPFIEQGLEQTLLFAPGQPMQQTESGKVWRLRSSDQQSVVALSNGALTLETTAYPGRTDFCGELTRLAEAFHAVTHVPSYNRVAVRYTNRLTGPDTLERLPQLIQPEFLGLVGAPQGSGMRLAHMLSQALLSFGDTDRLLVQFGLLPESGTFEPTLPPVGEPSWVLDLDSYAEFPDPRRGLSADADVVSRTAIDCAERAHTLFRWAVKDAFLTHFGGQV